MWTTCETMLDDILCFLWIFRRKFKNTFPIILYPTGLLRVFTIIENHWTDSSDIVTSQPHCRNVTIIIYYIIEVIQKIKNGSIRFSNLFTSNCRVNVKFKFIEYQIYKTEICFFFYRKTIIFTLFNLFLCTGGDASITSIDVSAVVTVISRKCEQS